MAKSKKEEAKADEATVTYCDANGIKHENRFQLPLQPGRAEQIINRAEELGCPDIQALRDELNTHYAAEW